MSPDTRTLAICGRAKVCVTLSRMKFGDKYADAIQQMLNYTRDEGY